MNQAPIGSDPATLHELFKADLLLRVPEFQRNYVWTNRELQMFWSDLTALWEGEGGAPLFLGAIVLHQTAAGNAVQPEQDDIIDGQQRLLTLYLCLTAIAEAFLDAAEPGRAGDIARQYLLLQSTGYRNRPKIVPAIHDSQQFFSVMALLKDLKELKESPLQIEKGHGGTEGLLSEAWQWIRQQVRKFAKDPKSETGLSIASLELLLSKLVERTHLVIITVVDKATAHQVFERLNIGGKELEDIDLVRNAVFSALAADTAGIGASFYNTKWDPFEEALGDSQQHYWYPLALMKNNKATKTGAYSVLQMCWQEEPFTQGHTGGALADRIMVDLWEYVVPFQAITGIDISENIGADAARSLRRLHRAGVPEMTYSFFFEAVKALVEGRLAEERFALFCEIVETAIARRVLRGGEMRAFQQAFKDVWCDGLTEEGFLVHIWDKLKLGIDEDMRNDILTSRLFRVKRRHWILTEFERWQRNGAQLEPSDSNAFHIDHVLPRHFVAADWPEVTVNEHRQLVDTWGNLALLPPKHNISKSAKAYQTARRELAKPGGVPFRSTGKLLQDYETWSAKTIRERSAQLAEWAIHRWPSTIEGYRDTERAKRLAKAN